MSIKILKPGLFSTIQDIGRLGYQDLGFSEAGALDYYSLSIAQKLIGNHGPAIEYTLVGPNIEFLILLPLSVVIQNRNLMVTKLTY